MRDMITRWCKKILVIETIDKERTYNNFNDDYITSI